MNQNQNQNNNRRVPIRITPVKLVRNVRSYVEGNINELRDQYNVLPIELKLLAEARQETCLACPNLVVDEKEQVSKCGICRCKFPGLTYSPTKKCPQNRWKK